MQQYITGDGLIRAALVILALAWAWNLIYTALSNARKEKERADAPLKDLENKLKDVEGSVRDMDQRFGEMCRDVNRRIDDLERGYNAHSEELRDVHQGQTELCRGVQALLEHALYNGNTGEMEAASQSIGKWLRTR